MKSQPILVSGVAAGASEVSAEQAIPVEISSGRWL
jgi:hypothetical protein